MVWSFEQFSDLIALRDDCGNSLSYAQLKQEGDDLCRTVDGRCLVFVLCRNELGSVLGYTAFVNGGIVPLLLNAGMESGLRDHLIRLYRPSFLWIPDDMRDSLADMREVYSAHGYVLLATDFPKGYAINPELCLLLTTSGSTGSPKLVRQSYANVRANAESIVQYLALDQSERPITTLPMNYTYGLSIINSHLLVGATVLLTDRPLIQREFWQFFREQGATSFGGVPYTYEMLDKLRFTRMDLPSLRTMTQAGGKLSLALHEKFAEYAAEQGKNFVVMYGQCEATARMGYLPTEKAIEKCGSMGVAIPNGRFRLIDDAGCEIMTPNTTGELVYEGANVTLGYAECGEDLNKGDERGGILHTGDMAQFDEDGYYYIVGRKKRFLKIYGNRVNLDEIDRMIQAHYENLDCASAGSDDHMMLYITDETMLDEVKTFVSHKTGLNPAAFQVIALREIPRNDAGKVLYQKLSEYGNA